MKQSKEKISVLAIVIIMLIRSAISFAQFNLKYTLDREYKEYVVKILQIEKQEETKSVYLVGLGKVDKGNYTYKEKFLLNVYEDSKLEVGDILNIKGKIVIPEKTYKMLPLSFFMTPTVSKNYSLTVSDNLWR